MVRPRFYRHQWEGDRVNLLEVALLRVVHCYYGLLLLREYCEPFARGYDAGYDALFAFLRKVILWLFRFVTSPLKVLGLYAAISICGGPMACYRGVSLLSLTACAVARHPMQALEHFWH